MPDTFTSTMTNTSDFLETYRNRNALLLEKLINGQRLAEAENRDGRLLEAMAYSLTNGGKRMRPLLCYASALAIGDLTPATDAFATALECIHAYSLVHDDLPAMDDDDLRRGRPTCHKAFDEATAILAGDGLQALAFETITSDGSIPPEMALEGCRILAAASGSKGMVLGQAVDLAAVDKGLSLEELAFMHSKKTGALIEASVLMGAVSAKATDPQLKALRSFALDIGLAFQVQDDIIDVTSDTETLGKPQGADAELNKPTYVSLLGLEKAKEKAQSLLESGLKHLDIFGDSADNLRMLANLIVTRTS